MIRRRGKAKVHRKFTGISQRANMETIKEIDKFVVALNEDCQELVLDVAEACARLARRNVVALTSKSNGVLGVRQEIADNIEVRTQHLKNDKIYRARVAIDYGLGGLQSLSHLLEFGFILTASYYGRERKVPMTIAPRPFMRPAFQEIEGTWMARVQKAVQSNL